MLLKIKLLLTTAKVLWEQFFKTLWFSHRKILIDQGPGFESQLFQELMNMARIEKLRTTSLPSSN